MKGDVPAALPLHDVKEEVVSEEESIEKSPNRRPSKKRHAAGDDAGSEPKVSGSKGYDHGNLPQSICRISEPSSANQISRKQKPSLELEDTFEAFGHSLNPKAKPSRFFTTEDEVALLESVIAFKEENDHEPVTSSDFEALHAVVKAQLHADCDAKKIKRKLARLKEKYTTNFRKEKEEKMKERNSIDPRVLKVNALARKIWYDWNSDEDGEYENGEALDVKRTDKANSANPRSTALEALPSSPNGDHALIIDFVANELKYMSHDGVRNKMAFMTPMEKEEIHDIWSEFQEKEMEFQSHRLGVAKRLMDKMKAIRKTDTADN